MPPKTYIHICSSIHMYVWYIHTIIYQTHLLRRRSHQQVVIVHFYSYVVAWMKRSCKSSSSSTTAKQSSLSNMWHLRVLEHLLRLPLVFSFFTSYCVYCVSGCVCVYCKRGTEAWWWSYKNTIYQIRTDGRLNSPKNVARQWLS